MPRRKSFLYYLFSKNNLPYYKEGNTLLEGDSSYLKPDGQPASLVDDPAGWKDTLVKYARNLKYMGLFRDMTVPMKFEGDGAFILQQAIKQKGWETECRMGILKLDRLNLPYTYQSWYLSEINFVKYKESFSTVQVECLEGGPSKYIKAYENTRYSITVLDDQEHVSVSMDGMELDNSATFAVTNGFSIDPGYELGNHLLAADVVQKEIEDIGGVFTVDRTKVSNNNTTIRATGKYIFKATAAGTVKARWKFRVTIAFIPPPAVNPAAFLKIVIRRIDQTNFSNFQVELLARLAGQPFDGTYDLEGEQDIPVSPGDELYLYGFVNVEGSTGDIQTSFVYGGDEPTLQFTYTYRHPESLVRGLTPFRLGEQLIKTITGGRYTLKSDFLSSLGEQIIITGADNLRGIRNGVIKTSLADFFKSLNRWCIGLGIEDDTVVIELLPYFLNKNVVIADIGPVVGAEMYPAEDMLFNTLTVGYGKYDYKEINGRLEFNQGQSWAGPGTKVQLDKDISSTYRADPFGIELLRINFDGKITTDTDSDGDNFFLSVKREFSSFFSEVSVEVGFFNFILIKNNIAQLPNFKPGTRFRITGTQNNDKVYTVFDSVATNATDFIIGLDGPANVQELDVPHVLIEILSYKLLRPAYSTVLGLLHPDSTFNIELSPKRSLLNWGAVLHSNFDKMDSEQIIQTSGIKNVELSTTLDGVTITEKEPVDIANLPEKLYLPWYFDFTTEVPLNLLDLINTSPNGKIRFWWRGLPWYGFLVDGGIKPATNDSQKWKLLATPDNDISKFNDYA